MKRKSAFTEVFKTKEGITCFIVSTVSLIASLCISKLVPDDWQYKKFVLLGCGFLLFVGCVMFTQYVGAMQNEIDKEESAASKTSHHPGKKR